MDRFRKLIFVLILLMPLSAYSETWDIADYDCSTTTDWTDRDEGSGVWEVDPAGQWRMDINTINNSRSGCWQDFGSFDNTIMVEILVYFDNLDTRANTGYWNLAVYWNQSSALFYFSTDGLHTYDADSWEVVTTTKVAYDGSAEWQTWRFLINKATDTCDIYLTDSDDTNTLVGDDISIGYDHVSYVDGKVELIQFTNIVNDLVTHVDYIKIGDALEVPSSNLSQVIIGGWM